MHQATLDGHRTWRAGVWPPPGVALGVGRAQAFEVFKTLRTLNEPDAMGRFALLPPCCRARGDAARGTGMADGLAVAKGSTFSCAFGCAFGAATAAEPWLYRCSTSACEIRLRGDVRGDVRGFGGEAGRSRIGERRVVRASCAVAFRHATHSCSVLRAAATSSSDSARQQPITATLEERVGQRHGRSSSVSFESRKGSGSAALGSAARPPSSAPRRLRSRRRTSHPCRCFASGCSRAEAARPSLPRCSFTALRDSGLSAPDGCTSS